MANSSSLNFTPEGAVIEFAAPWIAKKLLIEAAAYSKKHPNYKPERVLIAISKMSPKRQAWACYNFQDVSKAVTKSIHKAASIASLCENKHI